MVQVLNSNPRSDVQTTGWQATPEIRIVMDSTADWSRIMFNDIYGTNTNGIRVLDFGAHGWLSGNDSDDRIDAGHGLTFVDVRYNGTVTETGDIVGFFKGNNDFRHTKMYADVVLDIDMGMNSVYVYLMLAGAGTTTFEFINKETGTVLWQDSDTGRTFTEYVLRSMPPQTFFTTEKIDTLLVIALVIGGLISMVILNPFPIWRSARSGTKDDSVGL